MRQTVPMLDVIALASRLALVAVFSVAALAKLRDRQATAEALKAFGVPEKIVLQTTYLLPGAEGLAALLLVIPALYVYGAVWSLLLLLAFTTAVVVNLGRGKRPSCRCFGEMSAKQIGAHTVGRNLALSAAALYIIVAAPSTVQDARVWFYSLDADDAELSIAVGILALAFFIQSWMLLRLRDQTAELTRRLDALGARAPDPLPLGADAPSFELPTTKGTPLGLTELLARGKPLILIFTDPHCGPCHAILPQVSMWQKSLSKAFTVGIVSRGPMPANEEHARANELSEVMVQNTDEIAESYRAGGTPSAVRISSEGKIDSTIAVGTQPILELFEATIADHANDLWQRATGEPVPKPFIGLPLGSEPPDMVVHDLDGRQHRLRELLQQPTMLVFWSPRCGFCHQMVDDMRELEARLPKDRQIVYSTIGTAEENRVLGLSSTMVSDPDFEIGRFFAAQGTPAAVLIEGGVIASPLESGKNRVMSLSDRFAGAAPQRVDAPLLHPSDN